MKVSIMGYSGSGKSTLAKEVAKTYKCEVLHLDTVQFLKNWEVRPTKDSQKIVAEFLEKDSWVIDGNYSHFHLVKRLDDSEQIVFLLFSRWASLRRAIARYIKYRGKTRPDMAEGCEEKLDAEFVWWLLYRGRDKKSRQFFKDTREKYSDKVTIIKNQRQLDTFYRGLKAK